MTCLIFEVWIAFLSLMNAYLLNIHIDKCLPTALIYCIKRRHTTCNGEMTTESEFSQCGSQHHLLLAIWLWSTNLRFLPFMFLVIERWSSMTKCLRRRSNMQITQNGVHKYQLLVHSTLHTLTLIFKRTWHWLSLMHTVTTCCLQYSKLCSV